MGELSFSKSTRPSLSGALMNVTSEKHRRTRFYKTIFSVVTTGAILFFLISTGFYFFIKAASPNTVGRLGLKLLSYENTQENLIADLATNKNLTKDDLNKFNITIDKLNNNFLTLNEDKQNQARSLVGELFKEIFNDSQILTSGKMPPQVENLHSLFEVKYTPTSFLLRNTLSTELEAAKVAYEKQLSLDKDDDSKGKKSRRGKRSKRNRASNKIIVNLANC